MSDALGADARIQGLLDREEVRDLVARYAFCVDDHDLNALETMFHPDAVFDRDGHVASGWPEVAAMLDASMRGFRRMVHTPHAVLVESTAPDEAVGISSGHAELVTSQGVLLAAYRYSDRYARHGERWVFSRREVRFLYAVSATDYAAALPETDRVRFPGQASRPSVLTPVEPGSTAPHR